MTVIIRRLKTLMRLARHAILIVFSLLVCFVILEFSGIYLLPVGWGIWDLTYPPYTYETAVKKANAKFAKFCQTSDLVPFVSGTDRRDCGIFDDPIVEIHENGDATIRYPLKADRTYGGLVTLKTKIRTYGNSVGVSMPVVDADKRQ